MHPLPDAVADPAQCQRLIEICETSPTALDLG
jgi:hypothetical protein